ncbi:hypothetical protein NX059_011440 [Plenodomus lindquistii]|nr:hypothetical protein NX059_011440 [Plenodomus lindquistii]
MGCNRESKPQQMRFRIQGATYFYPWSAQRYFTLRLQPPNPEHLRERFFPYEFVAPRSQQQQDPVLRLIRDTIFTLNETPEHGLLMWNNNIRVVPSTTAPPIWPPNATNTNDVKFYTFTQDNTEFPPTLPVSIIPRTGALTADKLHVRKAGAWIPLFKFLLDLADPNILHRRGLKSSSYFWYKRTKKTFRLMDLPTELRLQIFEYAMAPMGEIYPLNKACKQFTLDQDFTRHHITPGIGYEKDCLDYYLHNLITGGPGTPYRGSTTYEHRAPVSAPNMSLLYVNKQVSQEVLQTAWEAPKKCFLDHWLFIPVLESRIGAAARFNRLNRIELAFTLRSWFKFFGVHVQPTIYITESENMGYYLHRLARNTRLHIRFRDPADGYAGDPWGSDVPDSVDAEEGTYTVTTCQSVLVDWTLTFAYEHIKRMNVTIEGYVRTQQKNYWDEIFCKARRGEELGYDNEVELKAIFHLKSSELPPTCTCRKSCTCSRRNRWISEWDSLGRDDSYFSKDSNFDYGDVPLIEERVEEVVAVPTDNPWAANIATVGDGVEAGDVPAATDAGPTIIDWATLPPAPSFESSWG